MKLREILPPDAEIEPRHADLDIGGVTADSRTVKKGDLFAAIAGGKTDGLRFVGPAIVGGAVAILAERRLDAPLSGAVAFVRVGNARRALALIAAKFYPRQPRTIAAVTGTSGKTSVAAFTRQIWTALGHRAATIGTIGIVSPRGETYGSLTTPDPVALHRSLDALAGEGVTHLAIEASSHGLDQYRLDGLRLAAGAFTNITRDHLDYHDSFEAYLAAKLRLFEALLEPGRAAIIDVDHEHADAVMAAAKARGLSIMSVGRNGAGIRLVESVRRRLFAGVADRTWRQEFSPAFAAGRRVSGGKRARRGRHRHRHRQRSGCGIPGARTSQGRQGPARAGRFEPRRAGLHRLCAQARRARQGARRAAARATGRLVVVFGAGGDRDRGKRPLMGAVAVAKADRVIVTDDNPRSEDAAAIRAAIMAAARGAIEIGDRREAIRAAIADLRAGDVLLIAGKGHETGQIIGDRIVPFSDHEAVAAALKELAA